jgi:hypothetical protein
MIVTALISRMSSRGDHDIRLEAVDDACVFINDWNRYLPGQSNARLQQFAAQALLIYGFQQARPGMTMHLDRQPGHPIDQWFRQQHSAFSVLTVLSALSPC